MYTRRLILLVISLFLLHSVNVFSKEAINYRGRRVKVIDSFNSKDDKRVIFAETVTKSAFSKNDYSESLLLMTGNASDSDINLMDIAWEYDFSDPALAGTGHGLLIEQNHIYLPDNNKLLIFISMYNFKKSSLNVKALSFECIDSNLSKPDKTNLLTINNVNPFEITTSVLKNGEYVFIKILNTGKDATKQKIVPIFIKFIDGKIEKCSSPLELFFPSCPSELVAFKADPVAIDVRSDDLAQKKFPEGIKINGNVFTRKKIKNFWYTYNNDITCQSGISYKDLLQVLRRLSWAVIEHDKFSKLMKNSQFSISDSDIEAAVREVCIENNTALSNLISSNDQSTNLIMGNLISNEHNKLNFFVDHIFKTKKYEHANDTVSKEEILCYYNQYKWSFVKKQDDIKKYLSLEEVKDLIVEEIKHLKFYEMDELLLNAPKVEIL